MSDEIEFYSFMEHKKVKRKEGEFYVETAAIMDCALCGKIISGMGGGGTYICKGCVAFIETGKARGCIIYEVKPSQKATPEELCEAQMLAKEYVLCDDKKLSEDAKDYKRELAKAMVMVESHD